MPESLKTFFEKIRNDQDLLLFWRLYHNPSSVLGNKQDMDEAEEEYNNLIDYCQLMMNNNLTEFVGIILGDEDFSKRADIQIWRKLNFFLYDSVDFKKYYHLLDDTDLMRLFKEEITVFDYLDKKGLPHINGAVMGVASKYNIYKKYIRLYEHKYPIEQVEGYSERESSNVRSMVNLKITVIKERTIDKQHHKDIALKWVEEDDYSENSDCDNMYLYRYKLISDFVEPYSLFPGICFEALDNLVCENRFLDIIEQKLEQGKIMGIPLENAMEIITMGIRIKKYQEPDTNFFRIRLGDDLVKGFDLKRAEDLISKLTLFKMKNQKQLGKVIQFKV